MHSLNEVLNKAYAILYANFFTKSMQSLLKYTLNFKA